jgi:hypothetical protein
LAAQLIGQLAHQEDATASETHLTRVQVWHGLQVEGFSFIQDLDLDAVGTGETTQLQGYLAAQLVRVADDVMQCFVNG